MSQHLLANIIGLVVAHKTEIGVYTLLKGFDFILGRIMIPDNLIIPGNGLPAVTFSPIGYVYPMGQHHRSNELHPFAEMLEINLL